MSRKPGWVWLSMLVMAGGCAAEPIIDLTRETRTGLQVTVYNQNLALVKDLRKVELKAGANTIRFRDVAARIDPTSVHFKSLTAPAQVTLLEQNYQYDLVNRTKLLQKYIDKEIELVRRDQDGREVERLRGTLLSAENGMAAIVRAKGRLYLRPRAEVELPELPAGLITKPTLVWKVTAERAGKHQVEVSYLTTGLTWHADYVAVVNAAHDKLDLTGWVTLDNKSGATYPFARLKLVAGDIHRITPPAPLPPMRGAVRAEKAVSQFQQKPFFEYHLYTLDRKTTLADNETKQLALLSADGVSVKKVFLFDAGQQVYIGTRRGRQKGKVRVVLDFKNTKANHLGMPLPKGKVRVYQADDDGSLQYVGEDSLAHTPRDEKVRLEIGNAFDLVGERKQIRYRKLADRLVEQSYEISLRNHKDEDVQIVVVEHLSGDWEILTESHSHKKKDAHTVEFTVPVEANSETKLTYTVRFSF